MLGILIVSDNFKIVYYKYILYVSSLPINEYGLAIRRLEKQDKTTYLN
jgi:hypothetical protein